MSEHEDEKEGGAQEGGDQAETTDEPDTGGDGVKEEGGEGAAEE